jgi:hypothetical protein
MVTTAKANTRQPGNFSADEFVTFRDVPIFAEHETTAKDGRKLRFTRTELEMIAARCNRRISETGDYAAVTIGHTPDPRVAEIHPGSIPPVVGFAGGFKIGVLGQRGQRQRYAILADLHIYKEDAGRVKKFPRRSPELWLEDKYEEMFLDPIALLGAEAPRLDMGLLYSAMRGNRRVEKYALATPEEYCSESKKRPYAAQTAWAGVGHAEDYAENATAWTRHSNELTRHALMMQQPEMLMLAAKAHHNASIAHGFRGEGGAETAAKHEQWVRYLIGKAGKMEPVKMAAGKPRPRPAPLAAPIREGEPEIWTHPDERAEQDRIAELAAAELRRRGLKRSDFDKKKMAAACASPMNTGPRTTEVRKMAAPPPPEQNQPPESKGAKRVALAPEEIQQIVDAIEQLDWVQYVKQQMMGSTGETGEPGGVPGEEPIGPEGAPPPAVAGPPGAGAPPPEAGPPEEEGPPPEVEEEEPPKEKMAGGNDPGLPARPPYLSSGQEAKRRAVAAGGNDPGLPARPPYLSLGQEAKRRAVAVSTPKPPAVPPPKRYEAGKGEVDETDGGTPSKGNVDETPADQGGGYGTGKKEVTTTVKFSRMQAELDRMRTELQQERYGRVNAQRRERLMEMGEAGFAFDVDAIMELGNAETMNDDHFERYCKVLAMHTGRNPVGMDLPTHTEGAAEAAAGNPTPPARSKERYRKEMSDKALRYCLAQAKKTGRTVEGMYEDTLNRLKTGQALPE